MKRFVILVFIFYIGFFSFLSSVDAKNYSSGDDAFEWHNLKKATSLMALRSLMSVPIRVPNRPSHKRMLR